MPPDPTDFPDPPQPPGRRREALALIGLAAIVGYAVWLLQDAFAPGFVLGWDALGHAAKAGYWRDNLLPLGRLDGWFPYWHGGFQLFNFYPPAFYVVTGLLSLLPGMSLSAAYNAMAVGAYALLPLSLYAASRWMGLGRSGALTAALLALFLNSGYGGGPTGLFYTGLLPNAWGLCLMPLVIAAWVRALDEPSPKRGLITAMLTGGLFLTHTFSAYFAGVVVAVFLTFRLARRQWHTLAFGIGTGTAAVLLAATWLAPALLKYGWRGTIGAWIIEGPAEMALAFVRGDLFGSTVAAWAGMAGILVAWRRGGWRREMAVVGLLTLALALGIINRYLPFGSVIGSTQLVRFHIYLGLSMVLLSGVLVETLWRALRASSRPWIAGVVPLLLVGAIYWQDNDLEPRVAGSLQMSSNVPHRQAISEMMLTIHDRVPPHARVLGEFSWDLAPTYGSPHLANQGLALWAQRADLAGNFPEGSRLANDILAMNQALREPAADFLDILRRFGVAYVLTLTADGADAMRALPGLTLARAVPPMYLWALDEPGQLLAGPPAMTVSSIVQSQDRFAFTVQNPILGATATLAVNAYPNWQATWNGQPVEWFETSDHRMKLVLPVGEGVLEWRFRWALWERACDILSAVAWIACLILLGRSLLFDRNRPPDEAGAR